MRQKNEFERKLKVIVYILLLYKYFDTELIIIGARKITTCEVHMTHRHVFTFKKIQKTQKMLDIE